MSQRIDASRQSSKLFHKLIEFSNLLHDSTIERTILEPEWLLLFF